ncbi:MAG: NUDIX hydrolase [Lachnospiraceae bacterium]|nr:NUDIX hydrolase [Lachnospiraceae bacterium]
MPAFTSDLDKFRGTGAVNAKGETLEAFIDKYDPKRYDCPSNTVDMAVFRSEGPYREPSQPLKLLMIRRGNHPSIGFWALPGGFVNIKENIADAARRELEEETGVKDLPMVQLRTWGDWDRDPRWRVITTAFLALVEGELPVKAGDDAADAVWMDVSLKEEETDDAPADDPCRIKTATYTLSLSNAVHGVKLNAKIKRSVIKRSVLNDVQYKLLSSDGIAVDHALIITDALLHLIRSVSTQGIS